jgi:hypothetical protein
MGDEATPARVRRAIDVWRLVRLSNGSMGNGPHRISRGVLDRMTSYMTGQRSYLGDGGVEYWK